MLLWKVTGLQLSASSQHLHRHLVESNSKELQFNVLMAKSCSYYFQCKTVHVPQWSKGQKAEKKERNQTQICSMIFICIIYETKRHLLVKSVKSFDICIYTCLHPFPLSTHAKKLQRASVLDAWPWGRAQTKNCLPMFGPSFFTVRRTHGSPWTLQDGGGGGPWRTDFQNTWEACLLLFECPTVGRGDGCCVLTCLLAFSEALVLGSVCARWSENGSVCPSAEDTPSPGVEPSLEFCAEVVSSRLSVFLHCSTGLTEFETLGLKKLKRLPCGAETVFGFFPLGTSDVITRFLPDTFSVFDGFKFSLLSSSSWDPGNASFGMEWTVFCSTFTRKCDSFSCLPVNSGR